jgi:hypothetical protein
MSRTLDMRAEMEREEIYFKNTKIQWKILTLTQKNTKIQWKIQWNWNLKWKVRSLAADIAESDIPSSSQNNKYLISLVKLSNFLC